MFPLRRAEGLIVKLSNESTPMPAPVMRQDATPKTTPKTAHPGDILKVGIVMYPGFTALDLTGPLEVLSLLPRTQVDLLAPRSGAVRADSGVQMFANRSFARAPQYDVICAPGGPGVGAAMQCQSTLRFLRKQAPQARFVTSVCTGALLLGAAGLLRGYRATTHWLNLGLLAPFGAEPVSERVVVDGSRITGGGVTAGIDFGLRLAAELRGREAAEKVQLMLEYDPAPPFDAGSPRTAPQQRVREVQNEAKGMLDERRRIVENITGSGDPASAPAD